MAASRGKALAVSMSSGSLGSLPFGALVRARRLGAGLTQRELAVRAGLSVGTVRDIEQGRTATPRPGSLSRLAGVLALEHDLESRFVAPGSRRNAGEDVLQPGPERAGALDVAVLGPLAVRRDGAALPLGPVRQRAVLGLLVLHHDAGLSRAALIDALWGERPPPTAVDMVQGYITRLRRVLKPDGGPHESAPSASGGEMLQWDGVRYRLAISEFRCDLADFGELADRAQQAAAAGHAQRACYLYEQALRLWRGVPLGDLGLLRCHPAVTELSRRRVAVVIGYADAASAAGTHEQPLAHLEAVADLEPLDERVHARLMIALAAAGQQAAALTRYETLRLRLDQELGVHPGPELADAHVRVLRQEIPIGAAPGPAADRQARGSESVVPRQLPPASSQFVGRAAELKSMDGLLDQAARAPGAVTILAICGTAGVGKTALALHWAHHVAERFPDGQLFLDLGGYGPDRNPVQPTDALRIFLDALQLPTDRIPAAAQARTGLFRSLLARRRVLVVLDNARDAAQVRPLLPGGSACLVIVTSRDQLAGLTAAEGAHPVRLDVLTPGDARALLAGRLGAKRLADGRSAAKLIELCARLPLALSVAAARAAGHPAFPLSAVVAELRDERHRLEALEAGEPASDVRAVLSWSYENLSEPAARLFRLLSTHPGPDVTELAAASLAGITLAQARRALAELTHCSLLAEHLPGRFTSHDLLRAYAAERARTLDGEADLHAALRRVLDHYLHTCLSVSRLLFPAWPQLSLLPAAPGAQAEPMTDVEQAQGWAQAEHLVLLASIGRAAAAGLDDHACQLPRALEPVFHLHSWWHDLQTIEPTALEAATRLGSLTGQANALRSLGLAQAMTDSLDEGEANISRALLLFQDMGDDLGRGRAHECMVVAFERHGRFGEAIGHARKSQKFYRAAGFLAGQASALNNLGSLYRELGDHPRALAYSQRSVRAFRELADLRGEAIALGSLGQAYHQRGQHAQALDCFQQALAVISQLGDRQSQADIRTGLGDAYHAVGDDIAARHAWTEALSVYEEQSTLQAMQVRARLRGLDLPAYPR
jgi:DNA-binding SARP family transcriptional activator/tetratricopeptide (TPR) repeat protein